MKGLQKNQGQTDRILGAMADMLTSLAIPNQQWITEVGKDSCSLDEVKKSPGLGDWAPSRDAWEPECLNCQEKGERAAEESYSVAGSEGSISTSVASLPPQASGGSAPSSPGSRRSVSTLKKWLTNPVRKLSAGGGGKGERQMRHADGKPPLRRESQDRGTPARQEDDITMLPLADKEPGFSVCVLQEGRDGPAGPEDGTPPTPLTHSLLSELLQGNGTLGHAENALPNHVLPGEDVSALMGDASSLSSATVDSEDERKSALEKSMYVLKELIETEKLYVNDLGLIVEGYMATMSAKGVPEDMKGKDKIVFGNIHQIYDWHKDYFLGELEKCVAEPERLAQLFIKHERRLHMYVVYCQNKPKSEHIVSEYIETYFEELRQQLGERLQLNDLLIKPVQRIMKYQLLLKDFLKYSAKAGVDTAELERAVEVMCFVPKRCNDMMNVGRLQGFEGKITAQGKLLQQDTFTVMEQDSSLLSRARERRVFLFEQIVIFSEPIDKKKGFSLPGYIFKNSIKVSCLGVEDCPDGDSNRFILTSRGADGNATRFVMQAATPEIRRAWLNDIIQILETQRNFLNALQSPIEYQRRESKTNSLGRAVRVPLVAALRPHSSASIDRQRLPSLRSCNSSLPSIYLPSQLQQEVDARSLPGTLVHMAPKQNSHPISPALNELALNQHDGLPLAPEPSQALLKQRCLPGPLSEQRPGEGGPGALTGDAAGGTASSTAGQRSSNLEQLAEDSL
ncbi:rho guanine nucleotide exchange factor 25 isoform X1 [Scleropages formosus]|uniref:rho guanine nucleotide exchange factor 25 isoform X1 n=1 Tax=Scleropages formosus TaxID=113540 RepID=UPI000878A44F|nr:rho guanine nucleotide exchange factor 25-like isoform X1 [Scleropages formosus]